MENKNIKYGIKNMVETSFNFNYDFNYENIDKSKVNFQFSYEMNPNYENNLLLIKFLVRIITPDNENTILAENTSLSTFIAIPLNEVIIIEKDGTKSSPTPPIIDTFLAISMGALRGMLVKNLKGTPLDGCILPLIPTSIFSKH